MQSELGVLYLKLTKLINQSGLLINLDEIFQPNSIAVVGASERAGSIGNALMRNLIERGFTGKIHPINPNHPKIWNLPACPSIAGLKTPVDLAVNQHTHYTGAPDCKGLR